TRAATMPSSPPATSCLGRPDHDPVASCDDSVGSCFRAPADGDAGIGSGIEHAVGAAAAADPPVDRGPGLEDYRSHHHHRHRPYPGVRRYVWRLSKTHSNCLRPLDRLCSVLLLSVVLLLRRRRVDLMTDLTPHKPAFGFEAPVHRALTEPILLAGA